MIEINLLSDPALHNRASSSGAPPPRPSRWVAGGDAGATLLLLLFLLISVRIAIHQIQAPLALDRMTIHLVEAENDLAQIARRQSVEERLREDRDALVRKIDHLEQFMEVREQWPRLWFIVAASLPPGVALRSFEELSAAPVLRMRLQGAALDDGSIGSLVERLSAQKDIRDVRLLQVQASDVSAGVHDFVLEVTG